MKLVAILLSVTLSLLLTGCVSPVRVDYDRGSASKFRDYKCFSIDTRETRAKYQNVVLSPIVDRRIQTSIGNVLRSRGLTQDCANPDFRVTFNTSTKTVTEVNDLGLSASVYGRRAPYRSYGGYSSIDISQYEEGTFIIDIIDNKSNELVWRGAYTKRLGWNAPNDEEVFNIVSEVLAEFPPLP